MASNKKPAHIPTVYFPRVHGQMTSTVNRLDITGNCTHLSVSYTIVNKAICEHSPDLTCFRP